MAIVNKKVSELPTVTTPTKNQTIFIGNHLGTTSIVPLSSIMSVIVQSLTTTGDPLRNALMTSLCAAFIPKPATATNGHVLTYQASTSTWISLPK